jgi:transcriptional regulator with XRE-family HTH domain
MKDHQETVGQRVKRLRKARGLRESDLARSAGLSERTIRLIESGQGNGGTLLEGLRIAQCLMVTPEYLAHGKND